VTSFFDDRDRRVRDLSAGTSENSNAFLAGVQVIEAETIEIVRAAIGDREFPDELREEALGIIAKHAACDVGADTPFLQERAIEYVQSVRSSNLLSRLHSFFHKVASSRTQTRFGLLSDHPEYIVSRREAHDREVELGEVLTEIASLVDQTREVVEDADAETVADLLHWARGARRSLQLGLEDDPGDPPYLIVRDKGGKVVFGGEGHAEVVNL
jgi:hypothetical protein